MIHSLEILIHRLTVLFRFAVYPIDIEMNETSASLSLADKLLFFFFYVLYILILDECD